MTDLTEQLRESNDPLLIEAGLEIERLLEVCAEMLEEIERLRAIGPLAGKPDDPPDGNWPFLY
jgi:hypothetical protein